MELTRRIHSIQLAFTSNYIQLLKRFTSTSKFISSLSEAWWGLLPAYVTLFLKSFKGIFCKVWIINEAMEEASIAEIDRLMNKPKVHSKIKNFIVYHRHS